MLTANHKLKRVEWAKMMIGITLLLSDAFQLFQNTLKRWYKGQRPIHPMPKDRVKIFALGGFCTKGKASLYCFSQIMGAEYTT